MFDIERTWAAVSWHACEQDDEPVGRPSPVFPRDPNTSFDGNPLKFSSVNLTTRHGRVLTRNTLLGDDLLSKRHLNMAITHLVMFQFKADAKPEAIQEACAQVLRLKDACVHSSTNKPYIKSAVGGKDISIEGLQGGLTHAFVLEFESVADRDYYVKEDKVHLGYIEKYITCPGSIVEKATVVDFTPGAF